MLNRKHKTENYWFQKSVKQNHLFSSNLTSSDLLNPRQRRTNDRISLPKKIKPFLNVNYLFGINPYWNELSVVRKFYLV